MGSTLIVWAVAVSGCSQARPETLHVATLNLAHGRGVRVNPIGQIGLPRRTFEDNLVAVAECLEREAPDVIALQEADAASDWSGDFDHVAFLAEAAGYPNDHHGLHAVFERAGLTVRYGTALLARRGLTDPRSFDLDGKPLDTKKGFVSAQVEFAGRPLVVVSVHLHSKLASARRRQARLMVEQLRRDRGPGGLGEESTGSGGKSGMPKRSAGMQERKAALVIMGDFNSTWARKGDAVRLIAEELNLQPYLPESDEQDTYPSFEPRRRIDWILISEELEFREYRRLPDRLSDHLGVVAELAWRSGA